MSNFYNKYFSGGNISSAKVDLIYDIKNHILYGDALSELIDDLEKHGLLSENSFTKKDQTQWNDDYVRFVAFTPGYFSRDYILHLAEVSEYLYQKKRRTKTLCICGIAVLIVAGLVLAFCRT
jgi:hypothetical protein